MADEGVGPPLSPELEGLADESLMTKTAAQVSPLLARRAPPSAKPFLCNVAAGCQLTTQRVVIGAGVHLSSWAIPPFGRIMAALQPGLQHPPDAACAPWALPSQVRLSKCRKPTPHAWQPSLTASSLPPTVPPTVARLEVSRPELQFWHWILATKR